MAEVIIRTAETDDVPRILETLRVALGETPILQRTRALWEWKHVYNPFGPSLVLIAETEGRIAGVRAMMRWKLTTPSGATLSCLRPVDTATHPDFARRGIFRDLTMTALEKARSEGIHLVFNTPNKKSAPGYLKMGWKQVSKIGVLARPRLGRAVRPTPGTIPQLSSVAPGLLPSIQMPTDIEDRPLNGLRTPRSPEYFAWRFSEHPTAQYGWHGDPKDGLAVARASSRKGRSELVLSDLIGEPSSTIVREVAMGHRARYMAGWFSESSAERSTAIRGGMVPVPWTKALTLAALPLAEIDVDVFDQGSWDIATSDLELL